MRAMTGYRFEAVHYTVYTVVEPSVYLSPRYG